MMCEDKVEQAVGKLGRDYIYFMKNWKSHTCMMRQLCCLQPSQAGIISHSLLSVIPVRENEVIVVHYS